MKGLQRKNIAPILLGVIALLLVCFLIYNQVNTLKSARAELAANRDSLAQAQERLQMLLQLKEKSAELQQQLEQIAQALPDQSEENNPIEKINSFFAQAGVDLLQISFKDSVDQKDYIEIPLNLTCQGSFNELLYLINNIQNGIRAIRINSIKLSKNSQDPTSLKADLSVSVFYLAKK